MQHTIDEVQKKKTIGLKQIARDIQRVGVFVQIIWYWFHWCNLKKNIYMWMMMIIIIIMSMGWDYVSELKLPTVLLFIPHMSMEKHGGMISKGVNWVIHQSSLTILRAESSSTKQLKWRSKWWIRPTKYLCSYYFGRYFKCRKILHGANGITTSPKEGVLRIFIFILKNHPSPSAEFEPANFDSNDKQANYYTTEDD
jgi:hypothetical protein